jgi:hypothetical protein
MSLRLKILCALLALAAAALAYKIIVPGQAKTEAFQVATEVHSAESVPKHIIAAPVAIKAYDKARVIKKLSLPPEVAASAKEEILTSAEIPASDGGYTAVTILDTVSGDVTTSLQEKTAPLFALGGPGEVGVRYGFSSRGGAQAALYARQDIMRIGRACLSGYGEVNAGTAAPEAKALLDLSIRF